MDPNAQTLTLALVLTAAGATAAASFITGIIALFKNVPAIGAILDAGREPIVVLVLSFALVVAAGVNAGVSGLEGFFGLIVAWYGIAELSMAVHDRASTLLKPAAA